MNGNSKSNESVDNTRVVRGHRATIPILYDDFIFEREKLDNVLKKFMRHHTDVDSQDIQV